MSLYEFEFCRERKTSNRVISFTSSRDFLDTHARTTRLQGLEPFRVPGRFGDRSFGSNRDRCAN